MGKNGCTLQRQEEESQYSAVSTVDFLHPMNLYANRPFYTLKSLPLLLHLSLPTHSSLTFSQWSTDTPVIWLLVVKHALHHLSFTHTHTCSWLKCGPEHCVHLYESHCWTGLLAPPLSSCLPSLSLILLLSSTPWHSSADALLSVLLPIHGYICLNVGTLLLGTLLWRKVVHTFKKSGMQDSWCKN